MGVRWFGVCVPVFFEEYDDLMNSTNPKKGFSNTDKPLTGDVLYLDYATLQIPFNALPIYEPKYCICLHW